MEGGGQVAGGLSSPMKGRLDCSQELEGSLQDGRRGTFLGGQDNGHRPAGGGGRRRDAERQQNWKDSDRLGVAGRGVEDDWAGEKLLGTSPGNFRREGGMGVVTAEESPQRKPPEVRPQMVHCPGSLPGVSRLVTGQPRIQARKRTFLLLRNSAVLAARSCGDTPCWGTLQP